MNADRKDLIISCFSKEQYETVGMGINLSISETICVPLKLNQRLIKKEVLCY